MQLSAVSCQLLKQFVSIYLFATDAKKFILQLMSVCVHVRARARVHACLCMC